MVIQVISMIPSGQVATYGQIADMTGLKGQARWVGRVLSQLPSGTKLPWHRVINSAGQITNPNIDEQRDRLLQEGVSVRGDRISLKQFQWLPKTGNDELPKSSAESPGYRVRLRE